MYRGSSLAAQWLGDGGPPLSVSAPCPTALSFGGSGEIISRAMTLITTERPVAPQPPGVRDPAAKQSRKSEGERRGARQEEFSSAEPTGGRWEEQCIRSSPQVGLWALHNQSHWNQWAHVKTPSLSSPRPSSLSAPVMYWWAVCACLLYACV